MEADMIKVVYWSQSGNTQAMAEAVGKGAADAGAHHRRKGRILRPRPVGGRNQGNIEKVSITN